MQQVQRTVVGFPIESMTDSELVQYCYNLIPNIPQAAAIELTKRLDALVEPKKVTPKYK